MRALLLLAFCCTCLSAQTLTFAISNNSGATTDVPLGATYQFPSTPQGDSSSITVKVTNVGSGAVEVALIYVGASANSPAANPNFTITGLAQGHILAHGASQYFNLNFTPSTTGQLLGYLQVAYSTQQGTCSLASGTCLSAIAAVSTLEGTGTPPQVLLTYNNGLTDVPLQPSSPSRLDFGSVATSSSFLHQVYALEPDLVGSPHACRLAAKRDICQQRLLLGRFHSPRHSSCERLGHVHDHFRARADRSDHRDSCRRIE